MDQEEFQLCKNNILYFARKLNILHFFGVPAYRELELTNRQRLSLLGMNNSKHFLLYSSRQYGKSLLSSIYAIHQAYFHGKDVVYFSNKNTTLIEVQARVKNICGKSNIPFESTQKTIMEFEEGSIRFITPQIEAARGLLSDIAIFDEFSFMDKKEEWWPCLYPAISNRTNKMVFTGTAFREYCEDHYNNLLKLDGIKVDKVGWEDYMDREKYDNISHHLGQEYTKIEFPSKFDM